MKTSLEKIEEAIIKRDGHLRFGLKDPQKVNYKAWAELCFKKEKDFWWACEWIEAGYPEPLEFLK